MKKLLSFALALLITFALIPATMVYANETIRREQIYIASPIYDRTERFLSVFSEGQFRDGTLRRGLKDPQGNIVVPAIYHNISSTTHISHRYIWRVQKGESTSRTNDIPPKLGLYDHNGNVLVPASFVYIEPFRNTIIGVTGYSYGYIIVGDCVNSHSRNYGVFDISMGELVVPMEYIGIHRASQGYGIFHVARGQHGLTDAQGNRTAVNERRWGVFNAMIGQEVVPTVHRSPSQDSVSILPGGKISVRTGSVLADTGMPVDLSLRELNGAYLVQENCMFSGRTGVNDVYTRDTWALLSREGNVIVQSSQPRTREALPRVAEMLRAGIDPSVLPSNIRLSHWFNELRGNSALYQPMRVHHITTGTTFYVRSIANGNHADVVPVSDADYQLLRRLHNTARHDIPAINIPVLVTIGHYTYPAAIWAGQSIGYNHFCLHFNGSTNNNISANIDTSDVMGPHLRGIIALYDAVRIFRGM